MRVWCHRRRPHPPVLVDVGLALDLDLHPRIHQSLHLDERGGRQIFAEIRYAARVDLAAVGPVGLRILSLPRYCASVGFNTW